MHQVLARHSKHGFGRAIDLFALQVLQRVESFYRMGGARCCDSQSRVPDRWSVTRSIVKHAQSFKLPLTSKCEIGVPVWTAVAERSGDTAFYCRCVEVFLLPQVIQKRRASCLP
jgi:hypothetical protein